VVGCIQEVPAGMVGEVFGTKKGAGELSEVKSKSSVGLVAPPNRSEAVGKKAVEAIEGL